MTSELDAAIRGMLVQYAKAKGFGAAEDSAEDADNLHQPQETKASDAHSDATTVKKAKMLRVARALVDSNPRVRNKGMASVGSFLETYRDLTEDEILHVWSTLYYAAWLSDKPLVQRDFFVRASLLHRRLQCPRAKTLFFCGFFKVLIAEWGKIDRHRTNKFLLFCRIFLAEWMHVMRLMKWEETFTRAAIEFLCQEVMLQSNARGIALHLADIVTDEFRVLLDAEACPSSESGSSSSDPEREQDEEERLRAFAWIFVPFLRCLCFSKDASLIARIRDQALAKLMPKDVDSEFVGAAVFSLASDKRIRSENRKQVFAAHERLKEENERHTVAGDADGSERQVGPFTPRSFADLIVNRVISEFDAERQKIFQERPCNPLLEYPKRKRPLSSDLDGEKAASTQRPSVCAVASSNDGSAVTPCEAKRAKKRLRVQQLQQQMGEPGADETQAAGQAGMRKAAKEKRRKGQIENGRKGGDMGARSSAASADGLRLPIQSSGVPHAASGSNSNSSGPDTGHGSSGQDSASDPAVQTVSAHSANCQPSGVQQSSSKNEVVTKGGAAAPPETTIVSVETQLRSGAPPRRRSLRISESAPSSKRVLFNLKKNKVVAFSRHAPSLAVGPAAVSPGKGISLAAESKTVPDAPQTRAAPPRGILRAAKEPGPPTSEETAPMPPIRKLQRPMWWGGATAELMAALRRALAQRLGAHSESSGSEVLPRKKAKKSKKKAVKHRIPSSNSQV